MNTVVREIASLVVGLTGVVLMAVGLGRAIDIGTCASGGPYAITRPCPEGSDMVFWMLLAGMIMWVAGMFVSLRIFEPGAGQVLWVAGFAGGGGAVLVKVLTESSMPPDARLGASIVAAVFIPMGLVVGLVGVVQLVRKRRGVEAARSRDQNARQDGSTSATDAWSRLKALNDLRSTGALTRAEFDALKADLAAREPDGPWELTMERIATIRQLAKQRTSGALSTAAFEARKRGVLLGQPIDPPHGDSAAQAGAAYVAARRHGPPLRSALGRSDVQGGYGRR
jgi:Short C-terminal domain